MAAITENLLEDISADKEALTKVIVEQVIETSDGKVVFERSSCSKSDRVDRLNKELQDDIEDLQEKLADKETQIANQVSSNVSYNDNDK